MGKTCFFIGHRDTPDSIYPQLVDEVERHITVYGVDTFVVGHYGRFDALAARAVREAKMRHPSVKLLLLLPYHPAEQFVSADGFDGTFYPDGMERIPRRAAILQANRRMIDHCDYLIARAWQPGSNAVKLLEYAKKNEDIYIINLND